MLGIYSVIAWLVSQRAREIGVRMALGATTGRVVREIALHGLRPVAVGLAAGLAGAIATTRVLEAPLFQIGARDSWTLAFVAVLLLAVAAKAAVIPGPISRNSISRFRRAEEIVEAGSLYSRAGARLSHAPLRTSVHRSGTARLGP